MEVFACFLIFLNAMGLEKERCWGSGSVEQYCFVSDHTRSKIILILGVRILLREIKVRVFSVYATLIS
jgi:hypothetical protein